MTYMRVLTVKAIEISRNCHEMGYVQYMGYVQPSF